MHIRLTISVIFLFLFPAMLPAQIAWKGEALKINDSTYKLEAAATIEKGWHIYGSDDTADGIYALKISCKNQELPVTNEAGLFADPLFSRKKLSVFTKNIIAAKEIKITGTVPDSAEISITGFASNNISFLPIEEKLHVALPGGQRHADPLSTTTRLQPLVTCGAESKPESNAMTIFLFGLLGGLLALLTPCVFPMVPLVVSFFAGSRAGKDRSIRLGLLYGFFIVLLYQLVSLPFQLLHGLSPRLLNDIATNPWVNLLFFVVFVVFALSFFGLFEIYLPGRIGSATDARSSSDSVPGIFFMALTLVVVSFSCTGPLLGTLLAGTVSGSSGAWQLSAGLGGFGLGLGIPFALFAMFPHWLKKLPRSGSWMLTLKKFLAFVELALALKFLSNADLIMHWGLLKRETFLCIWGLITLILGAWFMAGNIHSLVRLTTSVLIMLGGYYLIYAGFSNSAPSLGWLSGFAPPREYSLYASRQNPGRIINDYDSALYKAKKEHKPVLVDFTGWACVNCRKMEESTWKDPEVDRMMQEKYIVVSLYVDDKGPTGARWAAFESAGFGQLSQPLYALMTPDGKLLNRPVGYTPDATKYLAWLQCGLDGMKQTGK